MANCNITDESSFYSPNDSFLTWLQKHKPNAHRHFAKNKRYLMNFQPQSGRYQITVPGTHAGMAGAIDFDRQITTDELCLVLDKHPDLY